MSSKLKWRESFHKTRSHSQDASETHSHTKINLAGSDLSVSDDELEEYLGTLKKKSGVSRLWTGNTFDKVIDRTPDVSISSVSDGEALSAQDKSIFTDSDFQPNVQELSQSQATDNDKSAVSEPSSIKPMQAVHMISDLEFSEEHEDNLMNNMKLTFGKEESNELPVVRDVKSVTNDLSKPEDPHTLDEVTEEIEEDLHSKHSEPGTSSVSLALSDHPSHKKPQKPHQQRHHSSAQSLLQSSHHNKHRSRSGHGSRHSSSRKSSHKETFSEKTNHSYTADFSDSSKPNTEESLFDSTSYASSDLSASSARRKSQVKRSGKRSGKSQSEDNQSRHDVATQVNTEDLSATKQRLGIGMATLGPSYGNQSVDPSPIAPHVVSADAVEALTAYNPAVVALTDMLRQQLRLVEQFVDNSRRMYESYTSNINTTYKYTTLEDTLEYIQQSGRPHLRKNSGQNLRKETDKEG